MACGSWCLFFKSVFSRAFIYRYSSQARHCLNILRKEVEEKERGKKCQVHDTYCPPEPDGTGCFYIPSIALLRLPFILGEIWKMQSHYDLSHTSPSITTTNHLSDGWRLSLREVDLDYPDPWQELVSPLLCRASSPKPHSIAFGSPTTNHALLAQTPKG